MSKVTDEVVEGVYETHKGTRCCIVIHYDVNHEHGWTAKSHPLMQRSMPSILHAVADELESQQKREFPKLPKRVPRLVRKLIGA